MLSFLELRHCRLQLLNIAVKHVEKNSGFTINTNGTTQVTVKVGVNRKKSSIEKTFVVLCKFPFLLSWMS